MRDNKVGAGERINASIIDAMIIAAPCMAIYLGSDVPRFMESAQPQPIQEVLFQDMLKLAGVYFVISVYFFVIDYWHQGNSFGKRKLQLEINKPSRRKNFSYSFMHSLLKTLALIIWPISFVYCIATKGSLFYDNLLTSKFFTKEE